MAATSSLYASNDSILMERIFSASTTWSPPFDCRAYVTVIGAGASGASARNTSDHRAAAASGGGAGGSAKSLLRLDSSVTYTITIGAGGTSVTGITGTAYGVDGESSIFSGSDITDMTSTGGIKGVQAVAAGTVATQAGGVGGSATGGNVWNVTGGAGGSATVSYWETNGVHHAAAGGGAAGVLGTSYRGGNALLSVDAYDKAVATGGGGVGGRGGDGTVSGGVMTLIHTQGGSGDHDGDDISTSTSAKDIGIWSNHASGDNPILNEAHNFTPRLGINTAGSGIQGYPNYAYTVPYAEDGHLSSQGQAASIFHGLTGQGASKTPGDILRVSGPGAGGSGYAYYASGAEYPNMLPGFFGGGGGGVVNYSGSAGDTNTGYSGGGSFGAGGGGIAGYASSSNAHNSGTGGHGLVVVTILEAL